MAGALGGLFGGGGGGGIGGFLGSLFGGGGGGGILGILNSINQMSGGKIFGSTSVPFVPQGLGMADKNWQQQYGQLWDQMQQSNPQLAQQLQGAFQGGQGQQGQVQGAYQNLAGMTPQLMQMLLGQAGTAQGAQQGLMGAGNQLWNTAQDPQNALHDKYQQMVQDQSRAGTSARGIGMAPQAAGLENQAVSNFNMDWRARQLANETQGLQGMVGAYGQAGQQGNAVGQNLTGAMEMGSLGPQFMQQSAQWPFQLANMFGSGMQSNIYGPMLNAMQGAIPYMNQGQGGSANNFAAGQAGLSNFNTAFQDLAKLFQPQQGGGGSPGSYGDPYAQGGYGT
jgi:hypothetical protein